MDIEPVPDDLVEVRLKLDIPEAMTLRDGYMDESLDCVLANEPTDRYGSVVLEHVSGTQEVVLRVGPVQVANIRNMLFTYAARTKFDATANCGGTDYLDSRCDLGDIALAMYEDIAEHPLTRDMLA